MPLLRRIEAYLKRSRVSATRFGREALRDPQLVHDLRCGRTVRGATRRRIEAYLAAREAALEERR
jgi:2,4-dienoyl-CoA reductase-like NADH-dependent reductase (Old Yellow Enzyme family)